MSKARFSIIIPARDEEVLLPQCLRSIEDAKGDFSVEIIVVLNRCTDRTEEIAQASGCIIVRHDSKNLSQIRNAGAACATGDILVTIDADSVMSANMLRRIDAVMTNGKHIGGAVAIFPERLSLGILVTGALFLLIALYYRISGGLFFCGREDFQAIEGFDESRVSVEDIDFARRLKKHGKKSNKRFAILFSAYIVTSCRKFDRLGDWFFVRNLRSSLRMMSGQDQGLADTVWYDFKR